MRKVSAIAVERRSRRLKVQIGNLQAAAYKLELSTTGREAAGFSQVESKLNDAWAALDEALRVLGLIQEGKS